MPKKDKTKKIILPDLSFLEEKYDPELLRDRLINRLITSATTSNVYLALCQIDADKTKNFEPTSVIAKFTKRMTSVSVLPVLKTLHELGYLIKKGSGKGKTVSWKLKEEFIDQELINKASEMLGLSIKRRK